MHACLAAGHAMGEIDQSPSLRRLQLEGKYFGSVQSCRDLHSSGTASGTWKTNEVTPCTPFSHKCHTYIRFIICCPTRKHRCTCLPLPPPPPLHISLPSFLPSCLPPSCFLPPNSAAPQCPATTPRRSSSPQIQTPLRATTALPPRLP